MSYCVHCGVRLGDSEKACPLCGTRVIDPSQASAPLGEPLFRDNILPTEKRVNRRFLTALLSAILLIPFLVVAAIDLILSTGLSWSLYVVGAELCLWVWFVLPVCFPKHPAQLYAVCDTLVVALYLLIIRYAAGGGNWYLPLALPICALSGVIAIIIIWILRRENPGKVGKTGWSVFAGAFLPCGADVLISGFLHGSYVPGWSLYVSLPLLVIAVILIVISYSVTMSEWIRRKMFF